MSAQLQFPGPELELAVIFFFLIYLGNPVEKDRLTLADPTSAECLLELLVVCAFTR